MAAPQDDLIRALAAFKEISARINSLGMTHNLPTTLKLIAENAVRSVAIGSDTARSNNNNTAEASAVIWVYDEAQGDFDSTSRVSAGEPEGASFDDFPRPDGLGRRAIRFQQRLLSYQKGVPHIHPLKQEAGARSLVCYPLIVGNETVGVLYVYRCDERRFNEVELLVLDNFVHLAAMAIHHGRQVGGLHQALARKVREMEKLRRASQLISSRTNLPETLQEILLMGLEITAAQYGSFELFDKKSNMLVSKALAGSRANADQQKPLPVNKQSIVGLAALEQKSLRIGDLHQPPWCDIYQPLPLDREMRSELAVPLVGAGGGLEGVLNIESPHVNAFSQEDQHLLEALATQAIIAIQEIRLLDTMQEMVELLLTVPLDEMLKLIMERACELINASAGYIWLLSEPDTLALRYSTENERLGEHLPLSSSITGRAIQLRQPVAIDDVRTHPDFLNQELAVEKGWVSALVVPLLASNDTDNPVGSFSLYTDRLRDFSDWDKRLLTCLANHAAVAIRDAEQFAQLQLTRQRQATAEAFAAVGDVGANLLHQLNNKFGAISVRVQGIEDKCAEALETWPYLAENLQEIAQSTRRAMSIVRDSMAQLQPAPPHPVEIQPCLERALQRAKVAATVEVIQQDDLKNLPCVRAGEKQLEMVFYNLIDNAQKAMDEQGKLRITGQQQNDEIVVSFADTGHGILPEELNQIFDFTSATVESSEGRLGFGLWWVKTFVDRFGGRVEVESTPGEGSVFSVWLPIYNENRRTS